MPKPPWAFEFANRGDIAEEDLQDVFFLERQIGVEKVEVLDDDLQRFGEMAELLAVATDVRRCSALDGRIGGVAEIDAEETESQARQDRFVEARRSHLDRGVDIGHLRVLLLKARTMAHRGLGRTPLIEGFGTAF